MAVAHVERTSMPLVVNHQGVVSAVTITFNLPPGVSLEAASTAIQKAVADMHLPGGPTR